METLLPAFYTVAAERGADAALMTAEYLAERPARFFGLYPRKGVLIPGADADITILAEEEDIWASSRAEDGLRWSPYDGRRFTARVKATYHTGRLAYDGRTVLNTPGSGRYLRRGESTWFQEETGA